MTGRNFIIIDDDKDFCFLLRRIISQLFDDARILLFNSATEAFEKMSDFSDPGVVFVDENLGDGKGSDLIESGIFNSCDVISMSSETNPSVIFKNLSNGVVYFLPKDEIKQKSFKLFLLGLVNSLEVRKRQREFEIFFSNLELARRIVNNLQHEVNNPLGAAISSLHLITRENVTGDEKERVFSILQNSFSRIKEYIQNLKNLVYRGDLHFIKDPNSRLE
ncbi:MAG: response regulator [Deltaproteobacteria bacterium]|nr:response regulator [Deltaproteobacteria bacterium]